MKEKSLPTFTTCQIRPHTMFSTVFMQVYITLVEQHSGTVCGFCVKVPRTVVSYVCRGKCSFVSHTFLFEREFAFVHTACTGNTHCDVLRFPVVVTEDVTQLKYCDQCCSVQYIRLVHYRELVLGICSCIILRCI